jgi:hypothetical protein
MFKADQPSPEADLPFFVRGEKVDVQDLVDL